MHNVTADTTAHHIYLMFSFTVCSLLLASVMLFADVVDRTTIVQDMVRLMFLCVVYVFLCYSVHLILNWSFDGVSVPYGYWNDTDVCIFYGSLRRNIFFLDIRFFSFCCVIFDVDLKNRPTIILMHLWYVSESYYIFIQSAAMEKAKVFVHILKMLLPMLS